MPLPRLQIGVDIVDERQIEAMTRDEKALHRTFTDAELADCAAHGQERISALARRFAAKEAIIKACRQPLGYFRHIEISHDASGAPIARWTHLSDHGLAVELSLSSAAGLAVAVAVVQREG